MTPDVTVHYQDDRYGNMPTTARGDAFALDGHLVVDGRRVRADLITNVHAGPCDHAGDQRSERARDNFRRKYR